MSLNAVTPTERSSNVDVRQPITNSDPPTTEVECLHKIYELLREQEEGMQISATRKERTALRTQGWANLSVVAIFLASLSAGLLALTGNTPLSHDSGTARKLTDNVANTFWYLTISLSLIVVFGALAGASADVTMRSGDGAALGRQLQKAAMPWEGWGSADEQTDDAVIAQHARRAVDDFLLSLKLLTMLAVFTMIIGLLVFTWAEQALPVALTVSASFPGAYAGASLAMSIRHRYNRHASPAVCQPRGDSDDESGNALRSGPVGWIWCCPLCINLICWCCRNPCRGDS